jgi:GAF domain-containing protein
MKSSLEEQLARTTQGVILLRRLLTLATEQLQIEGIEMAVSGTRSGMGYLHFFDENENVINLSTWSKSVQDYCHAETAMHYPLEYAGIWANSARELATVVHNDYQSIPDSLKGGLPEGHFPIYRHMSVPVFDHDKLVAIVGVGNKEEPYDETDILQKELLMSCLSSVLQQRRAHEILQRYSFEEGVTGIANRR